MKEIVRITIQYETGYGPVEESYRGTLTITANSMAYRRVWRPMIPERSVTERWSFRTECPDYRSNFEKLAKMMPPLLETAQDQFITDLGTATFLLTYPDKTRIKKQFAAPGREFEECFALIRQMAPQDDPLPPLFG